MLTNDWQTRKYCIDMSSPNIAKPFSIGHSAQLLSEIASHIFQKIGYQTVKVNHLGDWGKHLDCVVSYKNGGDEEAVSSSNR